MPRLATIAPDQAKDDLKPIYDDIKKHMGGKVFNIFQNMGNSPITLKAFVDLSTAGAHTSFNPKVRELIALVVAQANNCQYCLSAHTAGGTAVGLDSKQIIEGRKGESADAKTKAILNFAKIVVEKRGKVTEQDVTTLKSAGVSDKEVVELILLIVVNMFTNYFNHIVDPKVDFPEAQKI